MSFSFEWFIALPDPGFSDVREEGSELPVLPGVKTVEPIRLESDKSINWHKILIVNVIFILPLFTLEVDMTCVAVDIFSTTPVIKMDRQRCFRWIIFISFNHVTITYIYILILNLPLVTLEVDMTCVTVDTFSTTPFDERRWTRMCQLYATNICVIRNTQGVKGFIRKRNSKCFCSWSQFNKHQSLYHQMQVLKCFFFCCTCWNTSHKLRYLMWQNQLPDSKNIVHLLCICMLQVSLCGDWYCAPLCSTV